MESALPATWPGGFCPLGADGESRIQSREDSGLRSPAVARALSASSRHPDLGTVHTLGYSVAATDLGRLRWALRIGVGDGGSRGGKRARQSLFRLWGLGQRKSCVHGPLFPPNPPLRTPIHNPPLGFTSFQFGEH